MFSLKFLQIFLSQTVRRFPIKYHKMLRQFHDFNKKDIINFRRIGKKVN